MLRTRLSILHPSPSFASPPSVHIPRLQLALLERSALHPRRSLSRSEAAGISQTCFYFLTKHSANAHRLGLMGGGKSGRGADGDQPVEPIGKYETRYHTRATIWQIAARSVRNVDCSYVFERHPTPSQLGAQMPQSFGPANTGPPQLRLRRKKHPPHQRM